MAKKNKRPRTTPSRGEAATNPNATRGSKVEAASDDSSPSMDWIAALASQAASSALPGGDGRGGRATGAAAPVSTKEERIERRRLKKQRRQLQKEAAQESRNEKQRAKKTELVPGSANQDMIEDSTRRTPLAASASSLSASSMKARKPIYRTSLINRERLERLALALSERSSLATTTEVRKAPFSSRPAYGPTSAAKSTTASNSLPAPFKKRKWEQSLLQPRKRDYGGIGLARPTLYLELDDPSFVPKLEEEFLEHIPGFYGRSVFHNTQKRQASQTAVWRTLSDRAKASTIKVDGKKLSDLPPDQRVEAMLRAGLI